MPQRLPKCIKRLAVVFLMGVFPGVALAQQYSATSVCRQYRDVDGWEPGLYGVHGGAPAMGFPCAYAGYGVGVYRTYPVWQPAPHSIGGAGAPVSSFVPPSPNPATQRGLGPTSGILGPLLQGTQTAPNTGRSTTAPGARQSPVAVPGTKMGPLPGTSPGLSPLPTMPTAPSGKNVGPSRGSP